MTDEEIDELLGADFLVEQAINFIEMEHNSQIFRRAPFHRFITTMLAESNPMISISGNSLEYYHLIFSKFMMARTCFAFWDMKHNSKYENWPDAVKMDKFIEHLWKNNYEDDIKAKFIYNLY